MKVHLTNTDVIVNTKETKSHSTAKHILRTLSCDNNNVKLGDINDLQRTYGSEWCRTVDETFPRASMISTIGYGVMISNKCN